VNPSAVPGTYTAVLQVNGAEREAKSLFLPAGGSGTLTFTVTEKAPAKYRVEVSPFVLTRLKVRPEAPAIGQTVRIEANLTNQGTVPGTFDVVLLRDGEELERKAEHFAVGEKRTASFSVEHRGGSYAVEVRPFAVGETIISPEGAAPGETVTASAVVRNTSTVSWSERVALTLDGEEVQSRIVSLKSGQEQQVSFTATAEPGTYRIEVLRASDSFRIGTRGYILNAMLGGIYGAIFLVGLFFWIKRTRAVR